MNNDSDGIASKWNKSLFVIDTDEFKEGLGDWYLSSLLEDPAHLAVLKSINAHLLFILSALESGKISQAFKMIELLHGVLPIPRLLDIYSVSPQILAKIRSAAKRFEESLLIERAR